MKHALKRRKVHKNLVGKSEGKRPFARRSRRWKYNIKISFKKNRVRKCGLDSSGSRKGPMVGGCKNGDEIRTA
jgi:hypothetical protein